MKKCCGTCAYHIPMPLNEWACDNEQSENYGLETEYGDCCMDYESRNTEDE